MTRPLKPARQQALEHWAWIEVLILTQMKLTMQLFIDGYIHGHKHGKEEKHGVRRKPAKK